MLPAKGTRQRQTQGQAEGVRKGARKHQSYGGASEYQPDKQ